MATSTGEVATPSNGYEGMIAHRNNSSSKIASVLAAIDLAPTGIRYAKIAEQADISQHELVSIMSICENEGLVEKRREGQTNWYHLTDRGRDRLRELEAPKELARYVGKDEPEDAPDVIQKAPSRDAKVLYKEPEEDDEEEDDEENIEPLSAETPVSPDVPKGGAGGPCAHCGEPQRNGYAKRSHERVCKENPERPERSRADAYAEEDQDEVYDLILEGKTAREVSHKLKIPEPVLSKWIHQWLDDGLIVVARHGHSNTYAEAGKKTALPEVVVELEQKKSEDLADEETIEQLEKDLAEKVEIELKEQEAKDQPFRVYGSGTCRHCEKFYARLAMHEPYCVKNPERIKPGQRKWPAAAPPKPAPVVSSPAVVPKAAPSSLPAASVCSGKTSVEQRIAALIKASIDGDAIPASFVLGDAGYDIRIEISRRAQR